MLSAEHPSRIPAENLFNFRHCVQTSAGITSPSLSLCPRGREGALLERLAIIFAKKNKRGGRRKRKERGTRRRKKGETVLSRGGRLPLARPLPPLRCRARLFSAPRSIDNFQCDDQGADARAPLLFKRQRVKRDEPRRRFYAVVTRN